MIRVDVHLRRLRRNGRREALVASERDEAAVGSPTLHLICRADIVGESELSRRRVPAQAAVAVF
jgi:hypothetical protein